MHSLFMLQGCCERLALDNESTNWLVAGSSRGHLSVWDLRFQVGNFDSAESPFMEAI